MSNKQIAANGWFRRGFVCALAFVLTCSGVPVRAVAEVLEEQTIEVVDQQDGNDQQDTHEQQGIEITQTSEEPSEEDAIEPQVTDGSLEITVQSDNDTSGRCGENLTWELDAAGVLTIHGQGDMYDFFHGDPDRYPPFPTNKVKKVVVEEGVTSIGDIAFAWCDLVEEVQLPDTITRIGDGAFASKSKLTSIRLPANLTDIGANAFIYCTNLSGITIPTGVTRIGSQAFYQCKALTSIEIPDGVTTMGDRAFCDCRKLVAVFIPPSVTSFGEDVFSGTPWQAAQGDFVIVNGVLLRYQGRHDWNTVEIPDEVTVIGKKAFSDLDGSWNVIIPDKVTAIQDNAFARSGLQSVTIPGSVKSIGWDAFYRCGIKTATIGEGLTTLATMAFYEAEELQSVSLPSTVRTIGADAFNGCYSLASCNLPEGLETIGDRAFAGCKLKEVTIPSTLVTLGWGAFSGNSMKSVTIPANITSIGKQTFSYCRNLETVKLHDGINIIRESTFEYSGLTSIDLPEGIKTIEKSAFEYCTKLASIDFPSTLTTIGEAAFRNCSALESVELPEGITSAGDSVFASSGLTRISLPSSLKSVPGRICEGCSKLAEVTFAQGITEVRGTGFKDCGSLTSVTIPEGVKIIGDYCFAGCGNLTDVSLPSTLTRIDEEAFSGCSKLASIVLPAGLTSLGGAVFYNCSALADINLPSTLTYIGWNEFKGCKSLVDVVIPEGVITIDYGAFHNCTSLETLAIPESVTEMWNPVQKTDKLVLYVVPGSYAEDWAVENDFPFEYSAMSGSNLVAKVCGPDGAELTQGYTVYWYSEEGEDLGTGNLLRKTTEGTRYRCAVLLGEGLGRRYVQPSEQLVTATSQAETVSFMLEEFARATVRGTVRTKSGEAIARATVQLKQTFNDQYVVASTVEADGNGEFSFDAFRTNSILIASADGYYDGYYSVTFDGDEDDACIDVVLGALPSNRITLSLYRQEAALPGETGEVVQLTSANELDFFAYNKTRGEQIADFKVQYPYIVFGEGVAQAGDVIRLSATDKSGELVVQDIEVELDDARCAEAEWTFLQNGSIRIRNITGNEENTVMVFNKDGRRVTDKVITSSYDSDPLVRGEYICVLLKRTPVLRSVGTIGKLTEAGLMENVDYVQRAASVEDGVITVIDDVQVPSLDENKLAYTVGDATMVTSNRSEAIAGQYVTIHAMYEINRKYDSAHETIQLEVPEGMVFVAKSLNVNGRPATCTIADDEAGGCTVSVPVNAKKGTVRFYVLPADSGTRTIYAYLSFEGKTLAGESGIITQPVGSASVEVTAASIQVPANTGSKTVVVSGKAIAGCEVTVCDNGTVVGTTGSNKNGSWSLEFDLIRPRKYSVHQIYATITNKEYGADIQTNAVELFYNSNYVEISKVTMINTAHPSNSLNPVEYKTVFDFLHPDTSVPSYNYWPDYPKFTFIVEFTEGSMEGISNVNVVTTNSAGDTTQIPCAYDERDNVWIGTHNYTKFSDVPCKVGVRYDNNPGLPDEEPSEDEELSVIATEMGTELKTLIESNTAIQNEEINDNSATFDVVLNGTTVGTYSIEILDYSEFKLDEWAKDNYTMLEYEDGSIGYQTTEFDGDSMVTKTALPNKQILAVEEIALAEASVFYVLSHMEELLTDEAIDAKKEIAKITYWKGMYEQLFSSKLLLTDAAIKGKDQLGKLSLQQWKDLLYVSTLSKWLDKGTATAMNAYDQLNSLTVDQWEKLFEDTYGSALGADWVRNISNQAVEEYGKGADLFEKLMDVEANKETLDSVAKRLKQKVDCCKCIDTDSFNRLYDGYASQIKYYYLVYKIYICGELAWFVKDYVPSIETLKTINSLRTGSIPKAVNKTFKRFGAPDEADETMDKLLKWGQSYSGYGDKLVGFLNVMADSNGSAEVKKVVRKNAAVDALDKTLRAGELYLDEVALKLGKGFEDWRNTMQEGVNSDFRNLYEQIERSIEDIKKQCKCNGENKQCDCMNNDKGTDLGLPTYPIVDPSGYVYEAVPSNRVEGVKAQIYQYDYAVDEFGVPEDQKSEVLWDAQSYDQVNPQYTGADGTFGWDVPEGQWLVKFSKDGYVDADSRRDVACDEEGYLPVPPIQTEVNTAIVSKSAPVVSGVRAYGDSVRIDFSQYMQIDSVSAAGAVTVTSGGKAVSGTVEPINAEDNYEGTAQYASSFWFRSASKLSGTVTVAVKGARNYNGMAMESGYRGDSTVTQQPEGLEVSAPASVGHHNSAVVDVQVLPAKAGAGQTLSVASFSPSIVAPQVDEVVTDKNGRAQITLDGKLPGQGVLRVSLVGTDIEETFAVSVEASAPQAIDIADCQVALAESSFVYNGKEHKPVVTVTHDGTELVAGTDYEVAYANNVKAGAATVTVTGVGGYAGSQSVGFSIAKAAQKVTAAKASYGVAMGKAVALGATNKSAGGGALSYKTSNAKVAKVSAKGVVTPVGVGKATITVTAAAKGSYEATSKKVTVKVVQGTQVITAKDVECVAGKTVKLGAKASGGGKLTYKSSATKVATVSAKGVVAGRKAGTAKVTITAAATKNWKKATKAVTVKVGKANPIAASAAKKVVPVAYVKVKSKAQVTAANVRVAKAQGTVTFSNASADATAKKFAVDAKTGKVTVPKGTKRGEYAVVVAATAAGNKSYVSATKSVSYTIQVK